MILQNLWEERAEQHRRLIHAPKAVAQGKYA